MSEAAKTGKTTGLTEAEFVSEAEKLVADLVFFAARPVRIKLASGQHIAYTYNTEDTKHVIEVVLNPDCVKGVHNKDRARSILRGIGFHELLHHLHPAEAQYVQANKEGFMPLLNLIDDEQNERRGTAANPAWGAHFQTVCAFIFPTAKRKGNAISTGIADGGKSDSESESTKSGFAAHETYRLRWNEFAYYFRRHIPHPDAARASKVNGNSGTGSNDAVAEALDLIPTNFKDLSKDELLDLTREVHLTLAKGLDIPAPKQEEEEENKEKPKPKGGAASAGGDNPTARYDDKLPWWKALFMSKWSWAALGLFLIVWAALFSRGGSDFWFNAAIILAGIGGTLVAAIFLQAFLRKFFAKLRKQQAETTLSTASRPDGLFKRMWNKVAEKSKEVLGRAFGWVPRVLEIFVGNGPVMRTWRGIKLGFNWTWRGIKFSYFKITWALNWLWQNKLLRIFLISVPAAALLLMLWAVFTRTGEVNWWLAVLLLLLLLLLAFLAWYFRAKLKDFLMEPINMDADFEHAANFTPPRDIETLDFNLIEDVLQVDCDTDFLDAHLPTVQPLAQALRPVLAKVGKRPKEKEDVPDGHDIIDEIEALYVGQTDIFVEDVEVNAASLHIEVAVDCSSSMTSENATLQRGEKFALAKLFALLVEEATRGQRGISTHFWGFTDRVIYDCGTAGEYKITGLRAMGGNNDSAMLYHMGKSAQASGKHVKMLFMLSDGQPSECSWGSLRNLVIRMEADGMVPWHFALDTIKDSAFERYFTDLCGQPLPEAIMTMCGILAAIANDK